MKKHCSAMFKKCEEFIDSAEDLSDNSEAGDTADSNDSGSDDED